MANKLFEKIETDALAAIDAVDAEYDRARRLANPDMVKLDREIEEIDLQIVEIRLVISNSLKGAEAEMQRARAEREYDIHLLNTFARYGITEEEYHQWVLDRDESYSLFVHNERVQAESEMDRDDGSDDYSNDEIGWIEDINGAEDCSWD